MTKNTQSASSCGCLHHCFKISQFLSFQTKMKPEKLKTKTGPAAFPNVSIFAGFKLWSSVDTGHFRCCIFHQKQSVAVAREPHSWWMWMHAATTVYSPVCVFPVLVTVINGLIFVWLFFSQTFWHYLVVLSIYVYFQWGGGGCQFSYNENHKTSHFSIIVYNMMHYTG